MVLRCPGLNRLCNKAIPINFPDWRGICKLMPFSQNTGILPVHTMGLFSRIFNPAQKNQSLSLEEIFFQRSQQFPFQVERKQVREAVVAAEAASREEDQIFRLPEQYGDLVWFQAQQGDEASLSFLREALKNGATAEDFRLWWNLPDVERRLYQWEWSLQVQSVRGQFESMGFTTLQMDENLKRSLPLFSHEPVAEPDPNQPLPWEMLPWILAQTEKITGSVSLLQLSEKASAYRSVNAFLRFLRAGDFQLNEQEHQYFTAVRHHTEEHQIQPAMEYADKLLQSIREQYGEGSAQLALVFDELLPVYFSAGRYADIVPYLSQKIDYLNHTHPSYPIALNNLGQTFTELGNYSQAAATFQQALEHCKENDQSDPVLVGRIVHNLALALARSGNYPGAVPLYRRAIEIMDHQGGERRELAMLFRANLAVSLAMQSQFAEARDLLSGVLSYREQHLPAGHPDTIEAKANLAGIFQALKDHEKAISLFREVLNFQKHSLGEFHTDYTLNLGNLAFSLQATGREDEAEQFLLRMTDNRLSEINKSFPLLTDDEKLRLFRHISVELEGFTSFVAGRKKLRPELTGKVFDLMLATRGLILRHSKNLHSVLTGEGNEDLIEAYTRWSEIQKFLAPSNEKNLSSIPPDDLKSLEKNARSIERVLRQKSSAFASGISPSPTWQEVQRVLQPGEFLLELFTYQHSGGKSRYAGLLLKAGTNNFPVWIDLADTEEMENVHLPAYRYRINQDDAGTRRGFAWDEDDETILSPEKLYRDMWEPIARHTEGARRLYFCPTGMYHFVNPETLLNPSSGRYLIDELDIISITHPGDILNAPASGQANNTVVLIGNPDFEFSASGNNSHRQVEISPLPATQQEIEAIAGILSEEETVIQTGINASREAFLSVRRPRVLHVATHGFFNRTVAHTHPPFSGNFLPSQKMTDYQRSGLLLSGAAFMEKGEDGSLNSEGIVTAWEITQMDLTQTQLVVLSACETGLGVIHHQEGVYGIQRAFLEAGAECLITSRWKVDDQATADLMVAFYRYWLGGHSLSESFSLARKEIRQKNPRPYIWGAFVMLQKQAAT